ncbi:MAG: 2-oxoacid:acceptor oxidoreductase family protein, partial [Syntrophomonas sp.]
YAIPAQELANQVGLASGSNMVMLGVLLQLTNIINNDNIYDYLLKTFKGKYLDKMPLNMTTIKAGREYAVNMIKANNRNIA